ncbi:11749_t:CDS:2, partial [Racocetra fulgida]
MSDFVAIDTKETLSLTLSAENLQFVEGIKNSAKKNNVWVSIGVHENIQESSYVLKGDKIIDPVETPIGKVGTMICYDLRFPELSIELRKRGADVLAYPAAFTVKTGMAHWDPWGTILARCPETTQPTFALAEINLDRLKKIRTEMPVLEHRRTD